jgi:hypothetical protein
MQNPIRKLLNGFTLSKKIEFVAENFQMEGKPVSFVLYVTEANQAN